MVSDSPTARLTVAGGGVTCLPLTTISIRLPADVEGDADVDAEGEAEGTEEGEAEGVEEGEVVLDAAPVGDEPA
jgi:hypothetical protein